MAEDNTGNASFNSVTVGIARVGQVQVGKLDPRTGGAADGQNDLIEQVKKLGDDLKTSLGAMLDQLKTIKTTTVGEARTDSRHQSKMEAADKRDAQTDKVLIDLNKKVLETLEKTLAVSAKKDAELLDGIQQMTHGNSKDVTAGLKNFTASHRTVMRDIMQLIRNQASDKLAVHGKREKKAQSNRDSTWSDRTMHAEYNLGGPTTKKGRRAMATADTQLFAGNIAGRSATYGREKMTETVHNQAESMAMNIDRVVGGLLTFANTTDYATKKWKQFNDVAGAGLDSFAHFFASDFFKLIGAGGNGDSLGVVAETLNKGAQTGIASRDSQLFIAGKSLQQAADEMRALRKGTQDAGFDTNAFMDFKDANDILFGILTQLKRGGILEQMNADQTRRYMVDQLKQMQLTAENTGLTVKQVAKINEEAAKKAAVLNAGGQIKDYQRGGYDAFINNFAATNKEVVDMIMEMKGSGSFEQWASKNKDRFSALQAKGLADPMREIFDQLEAGRTDTADMVKDMRRLMVQTGKDVKARTQADSSAIGGQFSSADSLAASFNQAVIQAEKNRPGQGDGVMSWANAAVDFFTNAFPIDALKAVIGVPGLLISANILLAKIALNTSVGGLGGMLGGAGKMLKGAGGMAARGLGKVGSLLGGLGGIVGLGGAGAATGAGLGATMAGAGSTLGAVLSGAGKFALKGLPVVGGLAGGAIDRASGGSLLGAILSGAGTGALVGGGAGLLAGGVGAVPGALLGGLGGAISGAAGYGLAGALGAGGGTAPVAPSYTGQTADGMGSLARGMFDRLDVQIAKLTELIEVMKESNKTAAMSATIIRQTASINAGEVGESGSWLGAIKKLWG